MLTFRKPELTYKTGKDKEWLTANGLGGYASSTLLGLNTRKYHGLLITAPHTPSKRYLQLAKIDEEIKLDERHYSLGCTQYPNVIHPEGYKINSPKNGEILLRPALTCRNIHDLKREGELTFKQEKTGEATLITTPNPDLPTLMLGSTAPYTTQGFWLKNVEYEEERARGYASQEDLYCPGSFRTPFKKGITKTTLLATGGLAHDAKTSFKELYSDDDKDYEELLARERRRTKSLIEQTYSFNNLKRDPLIHHLVQAADTFLIKKKAPKETSIIAGYPWFADWGRDSMIALPGLTLVTGRTEEAKDILKTFARHTRKGLVPNYFGEETAYNSADTSLWFIYAVHKFLQHTNNYTFVKQELWTTMKDIILHYQRGTDFNIHMQQDGLIWAGDENTNITWMDAKTNNKPTTPRHGKAVEVNALWHNALCIMNALSLQFKEEHTYDELATLTKTSFNRTFWNPRQQCLYDVVRDQEKDASIRPNQILAVSIPYPLLDMRKQTLIVKKVTEDLLTPLGLRSLSPKDPLYIGTYLGDQATRDQAYHNGTVWPWLLGPYITSYLKVHNHSELAKTEAEEKIILAILDSLREGGVGTISEIYDGDSLTPRGCPSQAWSVAEILRAYIEDVKKDKKYHNKVKT